MRKLICLVIVQLMLAYCNAQGSWDIGYIQVDSLSQNHIGLSVRLDFKSKYIPGNAKVERDVRSYVGVKDTVTLNVNNSIILFVERRKIYVDHGAYDDQYLESINNKKEHYFIYDARILELDLNTILVELDIESRSVDKAAVRTKNVVRIERDKLDGVMFRL